MKAVTKIAAVALCATMLGSCGIYKKYELDTSNSELAAEYVKARTGEADTTSFGTLTWQEVFTDPVLVDLINRALENNVDLRNAKLNIDVAHANLKGAKLAYFPSVALSPSGSGSSFKGSDMSWTYSISAAVSWEVDVFAKLLNSKRSAEVSLYQQEFYTQAVRSQIIGAVANYYYLISNLEAQLQVSRETAESWAQSVTVMENLKLAGRVNEAAVVQSKAQYASILASITDLEVSLVQANNSMSLLLNELPQTWNIPAGRYLEAPGIMSKPVAVSMLANRPDVRAAEAGVAVAYYAVNSARAAFYPSLSISPTGGFTNSAGSIVVNPGGWFINLAASLTAPIFSRGQNIARLEATKAQQTQAMNTFEYTILSAASEVSNDMTIYGKAVEKTGYLAEQTDYLTKSVEYTTDLLAFGNTTTTYLEVLTAQQSLLNSQISTLSCQLTQSQAVINMYQALGGGK